MSRQVQFNDVIREAWDNYDPSRAIRSITDISVRVSTNHVFKIVLETGTEIITKLSYFGTFENFLEDHSLINSLSINLTDPYDQFISRSLTKGNIIYTYRHQDTLFDAWVIFYNPIKADRLLPKILSEDQILTLGSELARFHLACRDIRNVLPPWSKTLRSDLDHLQQILQTDIGQYEHRGNIDEIKKQIDLFFQNTEALDAESLESIPVFIDWNIGNFSVRENGSFYSRWDYDWFRMSSRIMDFYFFSRVCSSMGDRTSFSYKIDTLNEDRFLLFLRGYHRVFPLTGKEVQFIKEAYRFFILNYVIKDGRYFFHEIYATRLQKEAFDTYFPRIDRLDTERILKALKL